MKFLAIDLEMNQPSGAIIQVGIYIFNEKGEEVQSARIYVNSGETLNPEIITLTGISQVQVDNGVTLVNAFEQVKWLRDTHKCGKQPIVWGAAYSNDSHLFWKQAYKFTEEQIMSRTWEGGNPLGHRVTDVKSLWQTYCVFNGGSIKGGLEKALEKTKLGWDDKFGKNHDALADAYNTARMFLWFKDHLK